MKSRGSKVNKQEKKCKKQNVNATSVHVLGLTRRLSNALIANGIETLGQLQALSDIEIRNLYGVGRKGRVDIANVLYALKMVTCLLKPIKKASTRLA
jgi:DNA-directed RNA polymerase alpha subunit